MSADDLRRLREHLAAALRGRPQAVERAMVCMLAGGHLLIEDVPGVGKTTLARAMAQAYQLEFRRVQFTSDLLPADILGVSVLDARNSEFSFRPGPIFTNILLADELNRATPRTQSALLEAMSEGQVSIDDKTYALPQPFIVVATQNPVEHHGTFPLPESQLDRFLMRMDIGYPNADEERTLMLGATGAAAEATVSMPPEKLRELQRRTAAVHFAAPVVDYMLALIRATRDDPAIELGVSTRGALAFKRTAQAFAMLDNRDYATPDDVQSASEPVLAHRLLLKRAEGGSTEKTLVIRRLLERIEAPV